jgi:hypothetical protein
VGKFNFIFSFIFEKCARLPKEGRNKRIEPQNLQQTSGGDMTCPHRNLQSTKA